MLQLQEGVESSKMGSNDGHPEELHKKKKRKSQEAESNELNAVQPELLPKPEPAAPNVPEKKKKRKWKKKSVLNCEEAEPHNLNAEHSQLCPKPEPTPPIKPDSGILSKPEPTTPIEPDSEILSKPEPTTPTSLEKKKRKRKKKNSAPNLEGAQSNEPNTEHRELCPKPEPTPSIKQDSEFLSEPGPTNPIDLEKKKKRKWTKKKSANHTEGAQSIEPNAEHPELCPKPEPTPSIKPDSEILSEPEPTKSAPNPGGAKSNEPKAEHPELCRKPEPTSSIKPGSEILSEQEPTNLIDFEKKKKRRKKKKVVPNHEDAQSNEPNEEHPELWPKPEPTPPIDSDTEMLLEPEPTAPVDTDLKKTKKRKTKKRNKKGKKNALKCEETESNELVAKATETPVRRLEGLGTKFLSERPSENYIKPSEYHTVCKHGFSFSDCHAFMLLLHEDISQ